MNARPRVERASDGRTGGTGRTSRWPRASDVVLSILLAAALLAPWLAPYAPDALDLANRRAAPSAVHPFGTDELGRDLFSRVLHGARVSLAVGVLSALVAGLIGVSVGASSGVMGGGVDATLMRLTDAVLSVPRLLLLMASSAILSPSIPLLVVLVGLVGWMETARVTRAAVLATRDREFVVAAAAAGATSARIAMAHLLPLAAPAIAVATTLAVGRGILLESALSFFGLGVQPPEASWGNMLYQAQSAMSTEPWLAVFPGACIFATVASINAIGGRVGKGRG
jgi:peptide/nickel transport system permease protein